MRDLHFIVFSPNVSIYIGSTMSNHPYQKVNRQRYRLTSNGSVDMSLSEDFAVSEEPLKIVLHWIAQTTGEYLEKTFMVTMRTPGDDHALVTGLLISYGIINNAQQISSISSDEFNQCDVTLAPSVHLDWNSLTRQFISHSGCGICGTNNVKKLAQTFLMDIDETSEWLPLPLVFTFSARLREHQVFFTATGGVHSAGLFDVDNCLAVKEDVGRHNAVDKVIGETMTRALLSTKNILMLSGRVSFELMQKAVAAKIPVVVAIGAPSSLAIAVAKQFNITLIGFVSDQTCNVYHGDFRLIKSHSNNHR